MADVLMNDNLVTDKIYIVQKMLKEGKSKFQAARAIGYHEVSGLDKYAKSLGYRWNVTEKNYELIGQEAKNENNSEKIEKILFLIGDGKNLDDIAKYYKMKNSQELAAYMLGKGYVWDIDKCTYVKKNMIASSKSIAEEFNNTSFIDDKSNEEMNDIDIMKLLQSNKGKLIELLSFRSQEAIPKYILKGVLITKSFYISTDIDKLLKDFSRRKAITQKDIIHTALIEYFQKYGYSEEVSALLKA